MNNYIEYNDMIVFHPGYYVKEYIDTVGIEQEDFAKYIDITPENLKMFLKGEEKISFEMAVKLSKILGTSVNYWLNLQQKYDDGLQTILIQNAVNYEDRCSFDAKISDLDEELIAQYKQKIGAEGLPTEQVLRACGFLKKVNSRECLTNAAVLLFAQNIYQFYPNCRIRFVRYEGIADLDEPIYIESEQSVKLILRNGRMNQENYDLGSYRRNNAS